jgi:hypothetical protein
VCSARRSVFYRSNTGLVGSILTWGIGVGKRVSKYVTNGSKTAVMDVIGFLCVSLGSSTVQNHESLGSRRACAGSEDDFCSQNGDRV